MPYPQHYDDVIMGAMASQITSLTIVSTVYSDADQRQHQSSASLAFVRGIHRGPVNSPHKWPVTRKMSPFDDIIMVILCLWKGNWRVGSQCFQSIGYATSGSHSSGPRGAYIRQYSVSHANISSDNGLSPVRHQAITWNNTGLMTIGLRNRISEILIKMP